MKLAVVLPSRGLIYSKTVEELYRELHDVTSDWADSYEVFYSHGRPIPDCFEIPTTEALRGSCTHVLFVEEDMVIPRGILAKMIARDAHAIACDYPVGGGSGGTVMYDPDMRAFFTGCGLLLVRADLLRSLPKPIWRTDVRWVPHVADGLIHFTVSTDKKKHYGQQDVAFGLRLYVNGMPIEIMDETIGQREMVKQGGRGDNSGFHVVQDRMEVVKRLDLTRLPERQVFEEILIDGKRVKVKPSTLAKLGEVERPDDIRFGRGVFEVPKRLRKWLILDNKEAYAHIGS